MSRASKVLSHGLMILALAIAVLQPGCGKTESKATPAEIEKLVWAHMEAFKEAVLAADVDAFFALVSERFTAPDDEAMDKAAFRESVEQDIEDGRTVADVDLSEAVVQVQENVAVVYPVTMLFSDSEMATGELVFEKEEAGWLIVEMNFGETVE